MDEIINEVVDDGQDNQEGLGENQEELLNFNAQLDNLLVDQFRLHATSLNSLKRTAKANARRQQALANIAQEISQSAGHHVSAVQCQKRYSLLTQKAKELYIAAQKRSRQTGSGPRTEPIYTVVEQKIIDDKKHTHEFSGVPNGISTGIGLTMPSFSTISAPFTQSTRSASPLPTTWKTQQRSVLGKQKALMEKQEQLIEAQLKANEEFSKTMILFQQSLSKLSQVCHLLIDKFNDSSS